MTTSTTPTIEPKAAHALCGECPLQNQPFVPGFGPDKARVTVVGEAPGANEVKQQRPFVGQAGQLLNQVLAQSGIERADVYVTNAVLCRPPLKKGTNSPPNAKALKCCRPRLIAEIEAHTPRVVIALGNPATQSLLQTRDGVTKARVGGRRYVAELGYDVIPTFHPAAALRVPDHLPSMAADIAQAVRVEVGWEPTQHVVVDSPREAIDWLARIAQQPLVALDVEVNVPKGKHPDPRAVAANVGKRDPDPLTDQFWLCIGASYRPGTGVVFTRDVVEHRWFRHVLDRVFRESKARWLYQNGKFDIQFLWSLSPKARVDEDTMLMHYLVDERKGTHSLEQLATGYLHAPNYKTETRKHLKHDDDPFDLLPKDILYLYNAMDCDVTLRLVEPLRKEMASDGVEGVYERLMIPGSNVLARTEYKGVPVDVSNLDRLEKELSEREADIGARLSRWVQNPRSWQQVQRALAEMGIAVDSTRAEVLEGIDEDFARTILEYRAVTKSLGTYVRGLRPHIRPDGRIHATFKLHGTEVGRLSCGDPNLQNQPRQGGFRDTFRTDGEHVFVSADYSGIELRVAAILSGDENLREVFLQNRNLHDENARLVFSDYKGKKEDEERYTSAKTVNFGTLYLETAGHLAHRTSFTYKQAEQFIRLFYERFPKVKALQKEIEREVLANGYLTSHFGRKRRFWLITEDNRYDIIKEATNFPFSSMASDICLSKLIELEPELRPIATPVITVHDSLTFETTVDKAQEVARTMREVMEDTHELTGSDIPTTVDVKVGPAWGSQIEVDW